MVRNTMWKALGVGLLLVCLVSAQCDSEGDECDGLLLPGQSPDCTEYRCIKGICTQVFEDIGSPCRLNVSNTLCGGWGQCGRNGFCTGEIPPEDICTELLQLELMSLNPLQLDGRYQESCILSAVCEDIMVPPPPPIAQQPLIRRLLGSPGPAPSVPITMHCQIEFVAPWTPCQTDHEDFGCSVCELEEVNKGLGQGAKGVHPSKFDGEVGYWFGTGNNMQTYIKAAPVCGSPHTLGAPQCVDWYCDRTQPSTAAVGCDHPDVPDVLDSCPPSDPTGASSPLCVPVGTQSEWARGGGPMRPRSFYRPNLCTTDLCEMTTNVDGTLPGAGCRHIEKHHEPCQRCDNRTGDIVRVQCPPCYTCSQQSGGNCVPIKCPKTPTGNCEANLCNPENSQCEVMPLDETAEQCENFFRYSVKGKGLFYRNESDNTLVAKDCVSFAPCDGVKCETQLDNDVCVDAYKEQFDIEGLIPDCVNPQCKPRDHDSDPMSGCVFELQHSVCEEHRPQDVVDMVDARDLECLAHRCVGAGARDADKWGCRWGVNEEHLYKPCGTDTEVCDGIDMCLPDASEGAHGASCQSDLDADPFHMYHDHPTDKVPGDQTRWPCPFKPCNPLTDCETEYNHQNWQKEPVCTYMKDESLEGDEACQSQDTHDECKITFCNNQTINPELFLNDQQKMGLGVEEDECGCVMIERTDLPEGCKCSDLCDALGEEQWFINKCGASDGTCQANDDTLVDDCLCTTTKCIEKNGEGIIKNVPIEGACDDGYECTKDICDCSPSPSPTPSPLRMQGRSGSRAWIPDALFADNEGAVDEVNTGCRHEANPWAFQCDDGNDCNGVEDCYVNVPQSEPLDETGCVTTDPPTDCSVAHCIDDDACWLDGTCPECCDGCSENDFKNKVRDPDADVCGPSQPIAPVGGKGCGDEFYNTTWDQNRYRYCIKPTHLQDIDNCYDNCDPETAECHFMLIPACYREHIDEENTNLCDIPVCCCTGSECPMGTECSQELDLGMVSEDDKVYRNGGVPQTWTCEHTVLGDTECPNLDPIWTRNGEEPLIDNQRDCGVRTCDPLTNTVCTEDELPLLAGEDCCGDNVNCTVDSCVNIGNETDPEFRCQHVIQHSVCKGDEDNLCNGCKTCFPGHPDADEEGCLGSPPLCDGFDGKKKSQKQSRWSRGWDSFGEKPKPCKDFECDEELASKHWFTNLPRWKQQKKACKAVAADCPDDECSVGCCSSTGECIKKVIDEKCGCEEESTCQCMELEIFVQTPPPEEGEDFEPVAGIVPYTVSDLEEACTALSGMANSVVSNNLQVLGDDPTRAALQFVVDPEANVFQLAVYFGNRDATLPNNPGDYKVGIQVQQISGTVTDMDHCECEDSDECDSSSSDSLTTLHFYEADDRVGFVSESIAMPTGEDEVCFQVSFDTFDRYPANHPEYSELPSCEDTYTIFSHNEEDDDGMRELKLSQAGHYCVRCTGHGCSGNGNGPSPGPMALKDLAATAANMGKKKHRRKRVRVNRPEAETMLSASDDEGEFTQTKRVRVNTEKKKKTTMTMNREASIINGDGGVEQGPSNEPITIPSSDKNLFTGLTIGIPFFIIIVMVIICCMWYAGNGEANDFEDGLTGSRARSKMRFGKTHKR